MCPPSPSSKIPTISKINRPKTSYLRFFWMKAVTQSASSSMARPEATMATASTANTSVMARAERIESNEKIRFMNTIRAMT